MADLGADDRRPRRHGRPVRVLRRRVQCPPRTSSRSTSPPTSPPCATRDMRTLADLIAFNQAHCTEEMKYFGQEVFELAEATSGDLSDPIYLEARADSLRLARDEGIDRVMAEHDLDAVISPSTPSDRQRRRWPAIRHQRAGRSGRRRQAGRHLDVRRLPRGAQAPRLLLRPRAGARRSGAARIPERRHPGASRCRSVPGAGEGCSADSSCQRRTAPLCRLPETFAVAASVGLRSVPQAIVIGRIARPTM